MKIWRPHNDQLKDLFLESGGLMIDTLIYLFLSESWCTVDNKIYLVEFIVPPNTTVVSIA